MEAQDKRENDQFRLSPWFYVYTYKKAKESTYCRTKHTKIEILFVPFIWNILLPLLRFKKSMR